MLSIKGNVIMLASFSKQFCAPRSITSTAWYTASKCNFAPVSFCLCKTAAAKAEPAACIGEMYIQFSVLCIGFVFLIGLVEAFIRSGSTHDALQALSLLLHSYHWQNIWTFNYFLCGRKNVIPSSGSLLRARWRISLFAQITATIWL